MSEVLQEEKLGSPNCAGGKRESKSKSGKDLKLGRKRKPCANPLQRGIEEFIISQVPLSLIEDHSINLSDLTCSLPKRYTVYPPLLLLPQNTFTSNHHWDRLIAILDKELLQALCQCIVRSFSAQGVTHVALNAPIALEKRDTKEENRMRSPAGVVPLYGDYGHLPTHSNPEREENPTPSDLQSAFWVRTVQNSGIIQVWAPLFSMFSRGNIVEKARILGVESNFEGLTDIELRQDLKDVAVVDMYAGIGYFVFSYLKRGIGRVWAWELNGWSIEGLRRGCEANSWGFKCLRIDTLGKLSGLEELIEGLSDEDRVVAFHGSNEYSVPILSQAKEILERRRAWKCIRHVNLGLLPNSKGSWDGAARILDRQSQGWIHVHENVDTPSIDKRREEIANDIKSLVCLARNIQPATALHSITCRHVENVKTYAPGVMHCVFDIHVPPVTSMAISERIVTKLA
ncbi:S-adenosylmethionine-dependent methyltransferase [Ophidiomyces ophidiicola]|nr:S-adenosylmethionine-dependent methyltransferase [Ophidiomyces ophidiicola]